MKRLILIVLGLLVVSTCCFFLFRKKEPSTFKESCWNQVNELKTTELGDGTYEVKLKAPDYVAIIEYLMETGVSENVTLEMIDNAVKKNPNAVKRYSFVVESTNEDVIQNVLMEQIAYDLLTITLEESME